MPIPDYAGDLISRRFLTGDWGGARSQLAERGVTLDWNITQIGQTVSGGKGSDQHYGAKSEALFTFDLDRMDVMKGAIVTMRLESRVGDSANASAGTLLPINDVMFFPQPPDEDFLLYITELRYTQFLSKEAGFFIGKTTTLGGDANEFAAGRGDTQFLTFNGHSTGALFGPYSTLGAGAFYNPSPDWSFGTSIVASSDSANSVGFDTLDDGLIWSVSAGYQYAIGDLPGGARATFQYAFDNHFFDYGDGPYFTPEGVQLPFEGDSWAFVLNGWQYVMVEEPTNKPINVGNGRQDLQGLGVWFRGGFADPDTNPVDWGISLGVGGRGSIPSRDNDTWGAGYAYCDVRDVPFVTDRLINSESQRIEAYYDAEITPSIHLSGHVNWAQPLLSDVDEAVVLSLRMRIAL